MKMLRWLVVAWFFSVFANAVQPPVRYTVLTDIDGELTFYFNNTFAATNAMMFNGVSLLRPDANTIFQDYSTKSYYIQYYAARPVGARVKGMTMQDYTEGWLKSNGFPFGPNVGSLLLSPLQTVSTDINEAGEQMGSFWQQNAFTILCNLIANLAADNKQVLYAYGDAPFAADAFIDCGKLPPNQIVLHIDVPNANAAGHRGTLIHSADNYTLWRGTYVAAAPYTSNITSSPPDDSSGSGMLVLSIVLAVLVLVLGAVTAYLLWQKYSTNTPEESQILLEKRSYS